MRKGVLLLILTLGAVPALAQQPGGRDDLLRHVQQEFGEVSALWQKQEYGQAVAILESLSVQPGLREIPRVQGAVLYNLACGYALLGETDRALASLQGAVDAGFAGADRLAQDPDLASIRSDPRFTEILFALRADYPRWESPAFQEPYRDDLTTDAKIAGLARVWAEVKYGFVHMNRVPELDWDSLFVAALPAVRATRSTAEYYRVLMKLCARLGDGHTSINVPGELFGRMYSRPAIDTRLIDGQVCIVRVLDDSLDLRPGLEILRIDGVPVHEYARARVAPYHSASTPQGAEVGTYSFYLLCGAPEEPVELELRATEGTTTEVSLPRTYHRILSYTAPIEFRALPGGIGCLTVNTFGDRSIIAAFDSLFAAVGETRALVIDLRQNTGGNGDIGYDLLARFTDAPFRTTRGRVRPYSAFARARGEPQTWQEIPPAEWPPAGAVFYAKPVAVLIGPQTGSAAEDFCAAFAGMKRGPLVGMPTAGSTGQPLVYALPGGGSGIVCTVDVLAPDGSQFVGRGIQPDIAVHTTLADLRSGRDAELEAALDRLR
jgi:carboxyl-terminal processing protease